MSLGSAASLAGTVPQAPLSPSRTAPRIRALNIVPEPSGVSPPPRWLPLQKAAEEPPRGRVLLVEDRAADALQLQRLLTGLGYRVVGPAGSATEAERLVERAKGRPLLCALLDIACPDMESLAHRLRARGVPVLWLMPGELSLPVPFAAPILHLPADRADLLAAITAAGRDVAAPGFYVTPPPQEAWPRVFPQL